MNKIPELQSEVAGYYRLEAVKPDGSKRLLADWFQNLITDAGMERFATAIYMNWCQVGTGNTAPAFTDTALASWVAGTSTVQATNITAQSSSPYYVTRQRTFRFAAGAAAGNLSEVGVGWAPSGSLFSRALILDGGGSPTTITVLADEVLDVTYQLRLYPPTVDSAFAIDISGVTYNCVMRARQVTTYSNSESSPGWSLPDGGVIAGSVDSPNFAYNGVLGAITGNPTGTSSGPVSSSTAAYSAASYQRDMSVTFGLNNGNLAGGISVQGFGSTMGDFQCSFSPAIAKDNTKTLTLNWRVSWARKTL